LADATCLGVRGGSLDLQSAYMDAAAISAIERPRTSPLSSAFLYTTAESSLTLAGTCNLSVRRSSSAIAWARLRSDDECTLVRICHFRRRSISILVSKGSCLPNASLLTWSMTVESPLSWMEKDVGIPTRSEEHTSELQ